MTDWKSLLDTNPEPSLLDAIAHAEEQQLEDKLMKVLTELEQEMLAVLEWAVEAADTEQYEACWYANARAVIAKAKRTS